MHSDSYEDPPMNRMLTINEVAHILHVHSTTVRRWEKNGQLRSHRLGPKHNIRFKKEDISNFVNSLARDTNQNESDNGSGSSNQLTRN